MALTLLSLLHTVPAMAQKKADSSAQEPAAQEPADVPWEHAQDVEDVPAFLRVPDQRPREDRPPPTREQLAALQELELEVARFSGLGGAYRDAIVTLVRRDYLRQRREREEGYGQQIKREEVFEDKARAQAIEVLEQFIEKYPNDPTHTPDAMFRLGELHFERASILFQEQMTEYLKKRDEMLDDGEDTGSLIEPRKDFSRTVELYRRMARDFPNYARIDGAYYLIGYCLQDMGESEEARLAWLSLVCANRYRYAGVTPRTEREDPIETAPTHPALALDGERSAPPRTGYRDPFEGCQPASEASRFRAETWLRIAEHHFDYDFGEHGLQKAISAYKKVMEDPEDRNYNLALYKAAWAYYRASNYPEAIRHFAQLVQWSDDERERTGRAGSELRAEAVQYLGIAFAYDDWNENQLPDALEGLPHGIERLQDPRLLPQDRAWTPEVYNQVGHVYFEEAKYPEAVRAWSLALRRWPHHRQAPAMQNMIARAHTRHNQPEHAITARAKLSDYGEGSPWWNANVAHPKEQREAERLADDALISTAFAHHQDAQRFRRRCVEDQAPDLCRQAQEQYNLAAQAYRAYLTRYPNNPQVYELHYNLADALYWSENYEDSAREYAYVRDSELDDKYLSVSARLVVESIKRLTEQAEAKGELQRRNIPPPAHGTPPQVMPVAIPQLLQRFARAREIYMTRVDEAQDTERLRQAYDFNNALLLYQHGYWKPAKQRFTRIYTERCIGPYADETGRSAWLNLRNMAIAVDDTEEVRRLSHDLQQRGCTFSPNEYRAALDCTRPEHRDEAQCVAGSDLTNLRYQDAVRLFQEAEKAYGDAQRRLFERAAASLVRTVNEDPNHTQAPLALEKAAIALERTGRYESAGRLYQRIIDEVGPRKATSAEEQRSLDGILSNAYFRLAFNANRFFDYERAVDNYRLLADSERFAWSNDPAMNERREGALINAAHILEYQQQYARAAQYYQRAADVLQDPDERRVAHYRVAEMAHKQEQWPKTVRGMREFIRQYQSDPAAGELLVQAHWRIAEAQKALGNTREHKQALSDVVSAYQRSGQAPGSFAAEYGSHAKFVLVDEGVQDFERFAIKPGRPPSLDAYVSTVIRQIEEGGTEAKQRAENYSAVVEYRRPKWMIAAFVRQGRLYEILARAVLTAPFVVPSDLQRKMNALPEYAREDVRIQVEDTIRQVLDAKVRPIECLAVARYALAARAARAGNVDDEYSKQATDRINAYGDERIAECIAEAAARDASMAAYEPGEFKRAPRGKHLPLPDAVSPPSLTVGGTL